MTILLFKSYPDSDYTNIIDLLNVATPFFKSLLQDLFLHFHGF